MIRVREWAPVAALIVGLAVGAALLVVVLFGVLAYVLPTVLWMALSGSAWAWALAAILLVALVRSEARHREVLRALGRRSPVQDPDLQLRSARRVRRMAGGAW